MTVAMNPPADVLAPTTGEQRIAAMDVVRGFALIGIFLMNVEFFGRATNTIGEGMPLGLTGLDWFASWFIAYFVQGKFWTIFSLLFGMGFALMLTRAERAGREFTGTYLRRILALAVFGAAHFIFLWAGDILFSYAVGALALMIALFGNWKAILAGILMLIAAGMLSGIDDLFPVAAGLAIAGIVGWYLRDTGGVNLRGRIRTMPWVSAILVVLGAIGTIAAVVMWLMPNAPKDSRAMLSVMAPLVLALGVLSARFHRRPETRDGRFGAALYLFVFLSMTVAGAQRYLTSPEPATPVVKSQAASAKPDAGKSAAVALQADAKADVNKTAKPAKVEKTDAEKAAAEKTKREADRAKRLAEYAAETREETRILSTGTYREAVEMRARKFPEKVVGDAASTIILLAMFLLGVWFVKSGVMERPGDHLPFFRKLALFGIPVGVGLGLIGSLIALSHVPGDRYDGFQFALGLAMVGNLPACLGYVSLVVLMLHSNSVFSKIRVLAPAGRMALTNYLTQSLLGTYFFYGYGLSHWGMGRAAQVVFVAVVFALQVAFSHWWLARFRYGPMEWLWRGFTYRQLPALRLTSPVGVPAAA